MSVPDHLSGFIEVFLARVMFEEGVLVNTDPIKFERSLNDMLPNSLSEPQALLE